MKNKNDFEFNYVAPTAEERREIESIKNSYVKKEKTSSKLETLRKLDAKVKNIPNAFSIGIGVIGLLIFGLGMSMILEWKLVIWGVVVSCVGVIPIVLASFVNIWLTKLLKAKYGEQIIKLSDELLNE